MGKFLEELLTEEQIEEIIDLYQNNVSLREIEKITHHGRNAVSNMLTRLGIKKTKGNHYRKYFFNFDFFDKINNEYNAYWLGFLYADGCILSKRQYGEQEFQLTLAKQDEQSIIDFKNDIESTYPIRYDNSGQKKNFNEQIMVIQKLRSQKTVNDLKKLGCVERKSLILDFPTKEQVPKEFIYDFIRGYFDGDGSIISYKNQYIINFVGTENFIKKLKDILQMGSIYPDKRRNNSWYLNINGNLQVLKFYHLLYDDKKRFMQRKYKKFQPLIQKYNESQGI